MILTTTSRDTRTDYGHKYDSPMAVYLDDRALSGWEDDWAGWEDAGEAVVRIGRWLVFYTSEGFVTAHKCESEEQAMGEMEYQHAIYDDGDDR